MMDHLGGDAVIIPNGVDVQSFSHATPMAGWGVEQKSLVFFGRVDEPRKGLAVLLKALPKIRAKFPELKVLIAGPGDCEALLEDLAQEDREAVTQLGLVDEFSKPNVYASGTIYVAPNTGGESFGIVLLEAMASGTPVLASDLAAFQRVLSNGDCGKLFTNEDSDSLANAVIELLEDDAEQNRLREAGLKRVIEFDWDSVADEVIEVYKSVTVPGLTVEPDMAGQMLGRLGRLRILPEKEADL
jgi:phosphatidylinositol alpha-mannosyltransferase